MTRIVWSSEAADELEEAHRWYAERSPAAADGFADEVVRALAEIEEAPARWAIAGHGTRRFSLRRFPFTLVYRWQPDGGVVELIAVAHGKRRPGYWRDR
ncbi:MAG: type II toxin-antitoxin system RelE/ParE family toxin [Deltaproteobacteria bacterium]|nr:type II toxin-antitoxin system RelE/ParE family toxin [Deltaproteobacteria bacterium]